MHPSPKRRIVAVNSACYIRQMMTALSRALAWLLLAGLVLVTVGPISTRPETGLPPDVERFAAYAAAGLALAFAYPRRWLAAAGLVVCAALVLEAAQLLTETRHAHLHDVAVKAAGGLVGVVAGAALARAVYRDRQPH